MVCARGESYIKRTCAYVLCRVSHSSIRRWSSVCPVIRTKSASPRQDLAGPSTPRAVQDSFLNLPQRGRPSFTSLSTSIIASSLGLFLSLASLALGCRISFVLDRALTDLRTRRCESSADQCPFVGSWTQSDLDRNLDDRRHFTSSFAYQLSLLNGRVGQIHSQTSQSRPFGVESSRRWVVRTRIQILVSYQSFTMVDVLEFCKALDDLFGAGAHLLSTTDSPAHLIDSSKA
jgi:hypothetical protein